MNKLSNISLVNNNVSINDGVSFEELFHSYNNSDRNSSSDNVLKNEMDIIRESEYPLISTTTLMSYLLCVNGTGVIINLLVIFCLLRKTLNGIFTLLLQISISDILSLTIVAIPEMWSHHSGTWAFGSEICVLYLGTEVFIGTTNVYFLIAITFHAIATANMVIQTLNTDKDSEEELLEDISENKSSRHSLVSRDDSVLPTRVTKSESTNKTTIPVILPVMLVWILAASLSIPEYALSTIIDSRLGPTICSYAEGTHMTSMQVLLSVFQLLIPFVILFASSAVMIFQLCKISSKYTKTACDSLRVLKLSLFLCSLYLILDVPRSLLAALHVLNYQQNGEEMSALDHFRIPPLNNSIAPVSVPFILSFLHFMSPVIKPISYIFYFHNSKNAIIPNLLTRPKNANDR